MSIHVTHTTIWVSHSLSITCWFYHKRCIKSLYYFLNRSLTFMVKSVAWFVAVCIVAAKLKGHNKWCQGCPPQLFECYLAHTSLFDWRLPRTTETNQPLNHHYYWLYSVQVLELKYDLIISLLPVSHPSLSKVIVSGS